MFLVSELTCVLWTIWGESQLWAQLTLLVFGTPQRGGKKYKYSMGENITLQRRSLKVDVQLSSFATFVLFEKHVESKFELKAGVRFGTRRERTREQEIELQVVRERERALRS